MIWRVVWNCEMKIGLSINVNRCMLWQSHIMLPAMVAEVESSQDDNNLPLSQAHYSYNCFLMCIISRIIRWLHRRCSAWTTMPVAETASVAAIDNVYLWLLLDRIPLSTSFWFWTLIGSDPMATQSTLFRRRRWWQSRPVWLAVPAPYTWQLKQN